MNRQERRNLRARTGKTRTTKAAAGFLGIATAASPLMLAGTHANSASGSNQTSLKSTRLVDSVMPNSSPPGSFTPINPTPQDLAHVQTLSAMSSLRTVLMKQFPDTFGGLYDSDGKGSFVILVAGGAADQAEIQTYVNQYLVQASPNDTTPMPIQYSTADHSLSSLFALQSQIVSDAKINETIVPPPPTAGNSPEPTSASVATKNGAVPIVGIGIDDKNNSVLVQIQSVSVDTALSQLQQQYNTNALEVQSGTVASRTDRYSDSPPWNGGDSITSSAPEFLCSSAFGSHDGSNNQYLMTAGHCSEIATTYPHIPASGPGYKWFNGGNYIGYINANALGLGADGASMAASSSDLFWKQLASRQTVANDAGPSVGNHDCIEGANSLEQCGTVSAINLTIPVDDGLFYTDQFFMPGVHAVGGDSGGPVIWPTIFGYIAQGIISATNPSGTFNCAIDLVEYLLGQYVNSAIKGT